MADPIGIVGQSIVTLSALTSNATASVFQSVVTLSTVDTVLIPVQNNPAPYPLPYRCCVEYLDNTGASSARFPMMR